MKQTIQIIATIGLGISLSACSSSSIPNVDLTDITPSEEAARTFATQDDGSVLDAGGAVAAGKTLTARRVAVLSKNLNYINGETSSSRLGSATVRTNTDGALTVTINGVEHEFAASDATADGFGYEKNAASATGGYVGVYSRTGPISDLLAPGNGYLEVLTLQQDTRDAANPGLNENLIAVFGTETADANLRTIPSATYNGHARVDVVPSTGFRSNSDDRIVVRSDVTMDADFGAGEISGQMTNFTRQDPGTSQAAVSGTASMDKTTFTNNGFVGSITGDAALLSNIDVDAGSATYSGAFYGPDANEVGGVIALSASEGGASYNGQGYFKADR